MYAFLLAKSAIEVYEVEHGSQNSEADTLKEKNIYHLDRCSMFESPVRERLQIFLQSSDLYDPEDILDLIEGSELWIEKVIWNLFSGQLDFVYNS